MSRPSNGNHSQRRDFYVEGDLANQGTNRTTVRLAGRRQLAAETSVKNRLSPPAETPAFLGPSVSAFASTLAKSFGRHR
ncbi:MAG: hypothetical protein ACI9HK_001646 [Pirellulaceae bacterium]|jgi:hypothetical protein